MSQRRLRPVVFPPPAQGGAPRRPCVQRAAPAAVVGVVGTAAAAALALESRTTLGRRLTSPLLSFFLSLTLRSLRILPPMHPVYDSLASRLLPAALPLMVLSAQIRPQRSVSQDRRDLSLMLLAFSVCSFASCGGALAAFLLGCELDVPQGVVSRVCGCLTATYIGGSANLAEVALDSGLSNFSGGILACLAAADVLLMCFYFAGLKLVANAYKLGKQRATPKVLRPPWDLTTSRRSFMDNVKDWFLHLSMALLALSIPVISKMLAAELHASATTSALSVALAAAIAQSVRGRMSVERRRAVAKSTTYMATLFLGCFYTTLGIGAGSGIGAGPIFLLSTVVLLGHLVGAFLGCELLNVACGRRLIKLPILLVASNAAVGGPSTATTFAESLEWTELVVPAAVCGTLGYALGTPVAFALMKYFSSFT